MLKLSDQLSPVVAALESNEQYNSLVSQLKDLSAQVEEHIEAKQHAEATKVFDEIKAALDDIELGATAQQAREDYQQLTAEGINALQEQVDVTKDELDEAQADIAPSTEGDTEKGRRGKMRDKLSSSDNPEQVLEAEKKSRGKKLLGWTGMFTSIAGIAGGLLTMFNKDKQAKGETTGMIQKIKDSFHGINTQIKEWFGLSKEPSATTTTTPETSKQATGAILNGIHTQQVTSGRIAGLSNSVRGGLLDHNDKLPDDSGLIYSPVAGTVVGVHAGYPENGPRAEDRSLEPASFGNYIVIKVSEGPFAGKTYHVGHVDRAVHVNVGDAVDIGTKLADIKKGSGSGTGLHYSDAIGGPDATEMRGSLLKKTINESKQLANIQIVGDGTTASMTPVSAYA